MANKYIRHGATFCGDGTTSSAAASAGAAGAWNDINILEGTAPPYGSLAAGDVVYIRSKSEAGADITRTISATPTLGSSNATATAPITWILDDGTIWSGINGVLTYDHASGNAALTVYDYNRLHANTKFNWVFKITQVSYYAQYIVLKWGSEISNAYINCNAITYSSLGPAVITATTYQYNPAMLRGCKIDVGSSLAGPVFTAGDTHVLVLEDVDVIYNVSGVTSQPVLSVGNNAGMIRGSGVRVSGQTANVPICNNQGTGMLSSGIELLASSFPGNMVSPTVTGNGSSARIAFTGADGGFGAYRLTYGGSVDSRQDGFYPYLNGAYPNSGSTGWSWKLYPANAGPAQPLDLVTSKAYTQSAATKTITVEFLAATSIAAQITKGKVWVDVFYIDNSTGLMKSMSSFIGGSSTAVASSTAAWSATTYGPTNLDKYKIALTTPTSIKQDTVVTIVFHTTAKSSTGVDILFVDPDPQIA